MSVTFAWWLLVGDAAFAGPDRADRAHDEFARKPTSGSRDPRSASDRKGRGTKVAPRPAPNPEKPLARPEGGEARPKPGGAEVDRAPVGPEAGSVDRSRPASSDRPGQRAIEPAVNRPTAPIHRAASPAEVRTTARVVVPSRRVPVVTNVAPVRTRTVILSRSNDHRFARPNPYVVIAHPVRPPPRVVWYRPYWTRWWVHPYWRWTSATLVIAALTFDPNPWDNVWLPPSRTGWVWVPGHFGAWGWVPGHWAPVRTAPVAYGVSWVFVPGYWMGTYYVDGFWRRADRPGWSWVDGYYLDDGSFVRGYWAPAGEPPQRGFVWEGGYWDGEYWVEGFWRPAERTGYRWVTAWLDQDGIYHSGYWEPLEDRPGMVWIPGWFTGDKWEEGYWVAANEYDGTDAQNWQPDEGWDTQPAEGQALPETDEPPPAIPVEP